jgi:hypothetical protein
MSKGRRVHIPTSYLLFVTALGAATPLTGCVKRDTAQQVTAPPQLPAPGVDPCPGQPIEDRRCPS